MHSTVNALKKSIISIDYSPLLTEERRSWILLLNIYNLVWGDCLVRMHRCYCFPDGLEDVLSLFFLSQSGLNVIALPNISISEARNASIMNAGMYSKVRLYNKRRCWSRIPDETYSIANNNESLTRRIRKSGRQRRRPY